MCYNSKKQSSLYLNCLQNKIPQIQIFPVPFSKPTLRRYLDPTHMHLRLSCFELRKHLPPRLI